MMALQVGLLMTYGALPICGNYVASQKKKLDRDSSNFCFGKDYIGTGEGPVTSHRRFFWQPTK
jgi:hypothetical protein